GTTGHAEVIKILFNEEDITFSELLLVFFKTHDPTTLNRQGNDSGTQYRSVVYYLSPEQEQETRDMIMQLTDESVFSQPIITEVAAAETFYPAENYHQNYFNNNQYQPYCSFVIEPKLSKFTREFKEKLRE
ncbi:MAG: peptide-methionine (S)-S-oxide reductase, partial [Pedobacter sp.]